jgi:hypothetical protein
VLELGFGWGDRGSQLTEDLGVRVERVAGRAPLRIGKGRPAAVHGVTLPDKRPRRRPGVAVTRPE